MPWVYAVICLAVIECFFFGLLVGRARVKYQVPAPAMTGNPIFERHVRVHYNTIELLVCLIPSLLVFAHTVSAPIAAGLGVLFIIGRVLYLRGYVADPAKRSAGFGLSALPVMIAMVGGLIGAVRLAVA
jgi:glutathione S-transferase